MERPDISICPVASNVAFPIAESSRSGGWRALLSVPAGTRMDSDLQYFKLGLANMLPLVDNAYDELGELIDITDKLRGDK